MERAGISPWRLRLVATVFVVFGVLLCLRLVHVQILDHPQFEAEAHDAHFWAQEVAGTRGAILDRNGLPLVTGVDTFEIHVDREAWELDTRNERQAVEELSRLLGVEQQTIRAVVGTGGGRDILLALNVPFALGETITAAGLPGVKVTPASLRRYTEGGLASQLLGFVGRDNQGLSGVEFDFDAILAGSPGLLLFERDSIGNPIPFGAQARTATESGADLVLTIDKGLQRIAEQHLAQALADTGARGGSILMMDPKTGDILALAASPTFNVKELNLADPNTDFALIRNRVVTDMYEPGSVFKVFTMAGAIDSGVVSPHTTFVGYGGDRRGGADDPQLRPLVPRPADDDAGLAALAEHGHGLGGDADGGVSVLRLRDRVRLRRRDGLGAGRGIAGHPQAARQPLLVGSRPGDQLVRAGHLRDAAADRAGLRRDRERRRIAAAAHRALGDHQGRRAGLPGRQRRPGDQRRDRGQRAPHDAGGGRRRQRPPGADAGLARGRQVRHVGHRRERGLPGGRVDRVVRGLRAGRRPAGCDPGQAGPAAGGDLRGRRRGAGVLGAAGRRAAAAGRASVVVRGAARPLRHCAGGDVADGGQPGRTRRMRPRPARMRRRAAWRSRSR